jgi:hypothetical protein
MILSSSSGTRVCSTSSRHPKQRNAVFNTSSSIKSTHVVPTLKWHKRGDQVTVFAAETETRSTDPLMSIEGVDRDYCEPMDVVGV